MSTQRFEELAKKYGLSTETVAGRYIHSPTSIAYQIYLEAQKDEIKLRTQDELLLIEHQKEINSTLILAETRIRELHDLNNRLVNIVKQLSKTIGDLV